MQELEFRRALIEDELRLQAIRAEAFAPVFASFRALLGEEIYELAQKRDDDAQGAKLHALVRGEPDWELWVARRDAESIGFMAIRLDPATLIGEIGLNAVDPRHAGKGVGTAMYEFALERMRRTGMKVAVVGTGSDASHAPARRAYQKAGFGVSIPSVWMCRRL